MSGTGMLDVGATELQSTMPPAVLPLVLKVYNNALRGVFVVALVMACLSIFPALAMEWKSLKKEIGGKQEKEREETNMGERNGGILV